MYTSIEAVDNTTDGTVTIELLFQHPEYEKVELCVTLFCILVLNQIYFTAVSLGGRITLCIKYYFERSKVKLARSTYSSVHVSMPASYSRTKSSKNHKTGNVVHLTRYSRRNLILKVKGQSRMVIIIRYDAMRYSYINVRLKAEK